MLMSPRLRSIIAGILLLLSARAILTAEPPAKGRTESIGLLVLKSGRFVEGRISQSAGGYVVEKSNGSMVVPFGLVEFSAVDRRDAYLTMRSRMKPPTPDRRMTLARWCLTHAMYAETQAELRTVLEVDPQRADARRMLGRLETILHPIRSRRRPKRTQSPGRTRDGFRGAKATALAGLKPAGARDFVSTIQPILMNKCGNARCHGSAANNRFRLLRIRTGYRSHRVFVERNLAAVLHEIDRKHPSHSRLLTVPKAGHGRGGRAIFFGPSGEKQYELLRTWTLSVASAPSSPLPSKQSTAAAPGSRPPEQNATPRPNTAPPRSHGDAFDPARFNRAVHGRTIKKKPSNSAG